MKKLSILVLCLLAGALFLQAQPAFVPVIRENKKDNSQVLLSGRYTEGSNKAYFMALSEWNVSASYFTQRHHEKFSWQTRINYGHTTQYDVRGNMLTGPGIFPVELFESGLGKRYRGDVNASFDIAGDINAEWRYGCDVAILSTFMNKTDCNRYKTYNVGGTLIPSFQWHRGQLAAGASLILGAFSEQVNSSAVGEDNFTVFFGQRQWYGVDLDWQTGKSTIYGKELGAVPFRKYTLGTRINVVAKAFTGDLFYEHNFSSMGPSSCPMSFFPADKIQIFGKYAVGLRPDLKGLAALNITYKNTRSFTSQTLDPLGQSPHGQANQVTLNAAWTMERLKNWSTSISATYFTDIDDSYVVVPYLFNQTLQRVLFSLDFHKIIGNWRTGAKLFAEAGWVDDDVEGHQKYLEGTSIYHNDALYKGWRWFLTEPGYGFSVDLSYRFPYGISLFGDFDILMRRFFDGIDLRHRLNAKIGMQYLF